MAQVLVRNLDEQVVAALRRKAELHGHSLEQELRQTLTNAARLTGGEKFALARRIRALAITTPDRWPPVGEVPTLRESGLPEYRAPAWQGLVTAAATPDAAVRRLCAELRAVMEEPAIRARLIEIGVEPMTGGPEEFDALMAADRAYWVPLIRELGITLDS